MDTLLKRLSTACQEAPTGAGEKGNVLCTSSAGLSVLLCWDRVVLFNTNAPDAKEHVLLIPDDYAGVFSNVEFNVKGTSLLLWSSRCAAIMDIYQFQRLSGGSQTTDGPPARLPINLVGAQYWVDPSPQLVRARWHHLDPFSVVLLFKSAVMPLVVVDTVASATAFQDDSEQCVEFCLNNKLTDDFVSFAFGPYTSGCKFTIFLLTERGSVFSLSPVVPARLQQSGAYAKALEEVLDDTDPSAGPMLQGPHYESSPSDSACSDLCFPLLATTGKLVLTVTRRTGTVDVLCLERDIGPSTSASRAPDQFLHAERVPIDDEYYTGGEGGGGEAGAGEWVLQADPAVGHMVHLTALGAAQHYLVDLCWLKSMVLSGAEGGTDEEGSDPILRDPTTTKAVLPTGGNPLRGGVVISNSLVGHWAVFMDVIGEFHAVNVSITSRQAGVKEQEKELERSEQWMRSLDRGESPRRDRGGENCDELLDEAEAALENIVVPPLPTKKGRLDNDRWLMETMSQLEKGALLKLELVQVAVRKKLDNLKRAVQTNKDLVTYHKNETEGLMAQWHKGNHDWESRLDGVATAQVELKERVMRVLMSVIQLAGGSNRLTVAEKDYRTDLDVWESTRQKLNRALLDLQRKKPGTASPPPAPHGGGGGGVMRQSRSSGSLYTSSPHLASPGIARNSLSGGFNLPDSPSFSPIKSMMRTPLQPKSSLLHRRSVDADPSSPQQQQLQHSPKVTKGYTVGLKMQPRSKPMSSQFSSGRKSSFTGPGSAPWRTTNGLGSPLLNAHARSRTDSNTPPPVPASPSTPVRPEAMEVYTTSMDAMKAMASKSKEELTALHAVLKGLKRDMGGKATGPFSPQRE